MVYEKPSLTVDCVIFKLKNNTLNILLIERAHEPFKGNWALPGGFVDKGETCEKAALRELEEETGIKLTKHLELAGVFSEPKRDPRGWTVSAAYFTALTNERKIKAGDDASKAKWVDINSLPKLAFDHDKIIRTATQKLKNLIQNFTQAQKVFEPTATVTDLQNINSCLNIKSHNGY